jgi:hypothetical protein
MEGWLIHAILEHLSPRDLIGCGLVSREFYALSRADRAWSRHKARLLRYCPALARIFEAHPQETDGKRVKKRHKVVPQGTWYIFCRFLMRDPFKMACERRLSGVEPNITDTIMRASMNVIIHDKPQIRTLLFSCITNEQPKHFVYYIHCMPSTNVVAPMQVFTASWNASDMNVGAYRDKRSIHMSLMMAPFSHVVHDRLDEFEPARRLICEALPLRQYYL